MITESVDGPLPPCRPAPVSDVASAGGRCEEVRWFVPADGVKSQAPKGRPVVRFDLYHLSGVTPSHSVKLRGRTTLEHKVRLGRVVMVQIAGVRGFAETWHKVDAPKLEVTDGNDVWITVRRSLWRRRGVEIGRLDVVEQRWWTVCVEADTEASTLPPALSSGGRP